MFQVVTICMRWRLLSSWFRRILGLGEDEYGRSSNSVEEEDELLAQSNPDWIVLSYPIRIYIILLGTAGSLRSRYFKTQVEQKVKYYFYCEVVFCEKVKVVRKPEMSRVNLTCCLTDCSNNKYLQFFVILQSEGRIP